MVVGDGPDGGLARPRILVVTNLLTHYRKPLYVELSRRVQARFVFFSDGGERYWQRASTVGADGLDASFPRGWWVGDTRIVPGLVREVMTGRYDVAVVSLVGKFALVVTYLGARLRRRPVVLWASLWAHPGTRLHRFTGPLTRALYRHADAIVTYGDHVSRFVVANGADPARVFVARQAVDLRRFRADRPPRPDAAPLRVLYVGRLDPAKGVADLMAALAGLDRPYAAVVVGRGPLEDRVRGAGVTYRGPLPNDALPAVYNQADVVVVPSIATREFSEPWSLAVNEALGCGCAVVASDAVGAVQDGLVTDGVTGLVYPNGDVAALTAALRRLADDPALVRRLAGAGHAAVQRFTHAAAADGFVRAIETARSGAARRGT